MTTVSLRRSFRDVNGDPTAMGSARSLARQSSTGVGTRLALEPVVPPFSYVGSKRKIAPWIISHFPPHRSFVEGFGGSGAVLLAKAPSTLEVYNDFDEDVVNFFQIVRSKQCSRLIEMLDYTQFSRAEHDRCQRALKARTWDHEIDRARMLYVCLTTSLNAAKHNSFSVSPDANKNRVAQFRQYRQRFEPLRRRLESVVIECRSFEKLLPQYDSADTLFFLDPPYVKATRGKKDVYGEYEMPDGMHRRLLDLVSNLKGKVILSGYRAGDTMYDRALDGWYSAECPGRTTTRVKAGSKPQTEVIWMNFKPLVQAVAA